MRQRKVSAIQMACTADRMENCQKADRLVREAAAAGAQIILLPELFELPYFARSAAMRPTAWPVPRRRIRQSACCSRRRQSWRLCCR